MVGRSRNKVTSVAASRPSERASSEVASVLAWVAEGTP